MSSLTATDKRYLENLLGMQSGYVLDFTDATFGEFFTRHDVDIHGHNYRTFGTSKAKKLRAFWGSEPDPLVGAVLVELLDTYEANCELNGQEKDHAVLDRARDTISRLTGSSTGASAADKEREFPEIKFAIESIEKLPIDPKIGPVIRARLEEAQLALGAGAWLSVILLCGSILEAVLLGAARQAPEAFNRARSAPKEPSGSPKRLPAWSLAQLIDTACEVGVLKVDVKKFSHGLRDFRNYIHPYEQLKSGFAPDEHTARLCFQVLMAALSSLAGERQ